jgi:hypothetical protein
MSPLAPDLPASAHLSLFLLRLLCSLRLVPLVLELIVFELFIIVTPPYLRPSTRATSPLAPGLPALARPLTIPPMPPV